MFWPITLIHSSATADFIWTEQANAFLDPTAPADDSLGGYAQRAYLEYALSVVKAAPCPMSATA